MNAYTILAGLGMFLLILAAICIALWVLMSLATMKALSYLGYDKAWMAWIPFASDYALMEATGYDNYELTSSVLIPMSVAKFWWVLLFILPFVPAIGSYLVLAASIMFRGWAYGILYAQLEDKEVEETKLIGYLSGFIGIIAMVKFFADTK